MMMPKILIKVMWKYTKLRELDNILRNLPICFTPIKILQSILFTMGSTNSLFSFKCFSGTTRLKNIICLSLISGRKCPKLTKWEIYFYNWEKCIWLPILDPTKKLIMFSLSFCIESIVIPWLKWPWMLGMRDMIESQSFIHMLFLDYLSL